MDYISVRVAADNWGISERRVQKLCEQGRVPGTQRRFGRNWMLPKDVKKPGDRRLIPTGFYSPFYLIYNFLGGCLIPL